MGANETWHPEVLSGTAGEAMEAFDRSRLRPAFYLAGGTGLALHFGHRRSFDLDFFSEEAFDEDLLLADLQKVSPLSLVRKGRHTLEIHVLGARVSLMAYPYPLLFSMSQFRGVSVADARDITCVKLSAIASRGTRRDFIDLYVASRKYGLPHLLELFQTKFARVSLNRVHLLKSLTYFEDAEREPQPDLLVSIPWEEVTSFFTAEVPGVI